MDWNKILNIVNADLQPGGGLWAMYLFIAILFAWVAASQQWVIHFMGWKWIQTMSKEDGERDNIKDDFKPDGSGPGTLA